MTQQQLAGLVHVSSRTILSIEKEQYRPSLMLACRMAEVFGVTVEEYAAWKKTKNGRTRNMKRIKNIRNFVIVILAKE